MMTDGNSALLTVAGAIMVAIITGALTILAGRRKANADVQTALNNSFQVFVTELQEERAALKSVIKDQGEVIVKQGARIVEVEGLLRQFAQRVESLERFISRNGLMPPEHDATTSPNGRHQ